MTSLAEVKKLS